MKQFALPVLILLIGGCGADASWFTRREIDTTSRPGAQATTVSHVEASNLRVKLHEAESEGKYFFYYGEDFPHVLHFTPDESNVLVYAEDTDPPVVTSALGITQWADGYGRPHSAAILKLQLEYNALVAAKIKAAPPLMGPFDATYNSSFKILVTGILDTDTASIPCLKDTLRNIDQRRKIDHIVLTDFFDAPQTWPPILHEWEDSVNLAIKVSKECEGLAADLPVTKTTEGDFTDDLAVYEATQFERVDKIPDFDRKSLSYRAVHTFDDEIKDFISNQQTANDLLVSFADHFAKLKSSPRLMGYLASHELFGLGNLSSVDRDESRNWPPPEELVKDYVDPSKLSDEIIGQLQHAEDQSHDAANAAEVLEAKFHEWMATHH